MINIDPILANRSIADLLANATRLLELASPSPCLDAEVLLSFVSGHSRTHFRAWPEQVLPDHMAQQFAALLARRKAGEPVGYLVGHREFWSLGFMVTPDVLIPRPETELLIEIALAYGKNDPSYRIADLGTGSGAIAVTLAAELPKAQVAAVDISASALAIAKENSARLGTENCRFLLGDWFCEFQENERFDLIVSNPPYVAESDPHLLEGDVRFEPIGALASGADGLDAIRGIVREAPLWLNSGGWLWLEHGYDQAESVQSLLQQAGFGEVSSRTDLQGHFRVSGGQKN